MAYVPQAAFIYNATVRENILFGLPYEEQRYQRAIQGASLGPDLLLLTGANLHRRQWSWFLCAGALSKFVFVRAGLRRFSLAQMGIELLRSNLPLADTQCMMLSSFWVVH